MVIMPRKTFYWPRLPMRNNHLPIIYPGTFLSKFKNSPAFWGADTVSCILESLDIRNC